MNISDEVLKEWAGLDDGGAVTFPSNVFRALSRELLELRKRRVVKVRLFNIPAYGMWQADIGGGFHTALYITRSAALSAARAWTEALNLQMEEVK